MITRLRCIRHCMVGILVLIWLSTPINAQIISQYIETESGTSPKGIEIWNNTDNVLDFSLFPLRVLKGTNGGALRLDFELNEGTLAPTEVIVIGTSDMQLSTEWNEAPFYQENFTFNGDDALAITYGDSITDRFGLEGSDPGIHWSSSGVSTSNSNIALKFGILNGDESGWIDPSLRFQTLSVQPNQDVQQSILEGLGIPPFSAKILPDEEGWKLLSMPNKESRLSDISDDILIQGVPGSEYPNSTANIYLFDEQGEWRVPTHIDSLIPEGLGIALYQFNSASSGSTNVQPILDVSGFENIQNVQVPLHRGAPNRFTLVGNPYPSFFDLQYLSVNDGAIQNTVVTWDPVLKLYELKNITEGFWVAPWEAFWVETSDGLVDSLLFPAIGKQTGLFPNQQTTVKSVGKAGIHFSLSTDEVIDRALSLVFHEEAAMGWDTFDATKLLPMNTSQGFMAFWNNEHMHSVVALPHQLSAITYLPLEIKVFDRSKEFKLSWEGTETLHEYTRILLHDSRDSSHISIRDQDSITFKLDSLSQETRHRFSLSIHPHDASKITQNEETSLTSGFHLDQNYPNPFNPETTIRYSISQSSYVKIEVYNTKGQRVATLQDSKQQIGSHQIQWNATGFASGIYILRLTTNEGVQSKKMLLIK
ncbi:MAG: T9SS C-terminal target domain-containing protein [Bacteroidetes bacterium]|nr:T9SS C-terminal target domain-containing protein [Bacteroidota bacterium]